jgi:hypothetical protein
LALLVALALCGAPASARGAPPRASDPGTALTIYREAYDAMSAGEWSKARELLLVLWKKSQTYDVAASLGQVEYQLLNFVAAARYMAFAIAHVAPKEKFANLERYRSALEEIRSWVGTVRVAVPEPGAEIRVDGELVGESPFDADVFVAPGSHRLEALFGGDHLVTKTFTVAAGDRLLQTIESPERSTTPVRAGTVAAGTSSALTAEPILERDVKPERSWVPVYVGAALAATGLAAAAGFGLAANSAENDADALRARIGADGCASGRANPGDCRAASDAVDRQQRAATLSTIGLGAAAVASAATLGYLFLWPHPGANDGAGARSEPSVALRAGLGTLGVTGAF